METPEMLYEDIFATVTGHMLPEYALDWVENGGVPGQDYYQVYEQLWEGRQELCDRFGLDWEDPSLEKIMRSVTDLEFALARRMFRAALDCAERYQKFKGEEAQ